ncbi:hypothetical protein NHB13_27820 [Delftia tsuruhatensis]|nr:hypothetical protein [Delftia tsuruhatensis]
MQLAENAGMQNTKRFTFGMRSLHTACASLYAAAIVPLLSCLVAASPAQAQALSVQVPHGLDGSAAMRENMAYGVDLWLMAHDNARRVLLLDRCTALDRKFPQQAAPAMVAASTEVLRWMTGEAYSDLPPEPYSVAVREMLPVLAKHAFSEKELASWDTLRNSPQGRRGRAIREVQLALTKAAGSLVDVSSGRYWNWPLARAARLADAHGLREQVDAAFEALEPGAAAWLRGVSVVPGETPADEKFTGRIAASGTLLAQHFIDGLAPLDKEAYERIEQVKLLYRWIDITQALNRFAARPNLPFLRGEPIPETVAGFCDSVGLPSCQPGGELHTAITGYQVATGNAARSDVPMNTTRRIVHGLPASGCGPMSGPAYGARGRHSASSVSAP